jgi:hypothetical protein
MFNRIAVLTAIAALTLAGTSAAGNGHGADKASSSISLVVVSDGAAIASASSTPNYGDEVTFDVSTTATDYPYVHLECFQNGSLVGEAWEGFFDAALGDRTFTLWAPQWSGGEAECTATLSKRTKHGWQELALTTFHVNG